MYCSDFNALQQKYANAKTGTDLEIKRSLDMIAKLFAACEESEYYYAEVITRHFCRIIRNIERQKVPTAAQNPSVPTQHPSPYASADDLMRAFYNFYRQQGQVDYREVAATLAQGRKDLVNLTMKDYVSRIYTFSGAKYLGKLFDEQTLADVDPVLFTYENIELILATFKTRDPQGQIIRQAVNLRSALRKLNEFKQSHSK